MFAEARAAIAKGDGHPFDASFAARRLLSARAESSAGSPARPGSVFRRAWCWCLRGRIRATLVPLGFLVEYHERYEATKSARCARSALAHHIYQSINGAMRLVTAGEWRTITKEFVLIFR